MPTYILIMSLCNLAQDTTPGQGAVVSPALWFPTAPFHTEACDNGPRQITVVRQHFYAGEKGVWEPRRRIFAQQL